MNAPKLLIPEDAPRQAGRCSVHGDYLVCIPPGLGRALAERISLCPDCGADSIAAQRQMDLAASEEERREARGRWTAMLLGRASVPERFRDATLDDPTRWPAHEEVMGRLRAYAEHWPVARARGASLFLFGPPSTGKTRAAAALSRAVLSLGASVGFLRQDNLSSMIRDTYGPNASRSEDSIIRELRALDLLVIDELGIGKDTEHEKRMLNSILGNRHEDSKPTLITSNNLRDQIEAWLGVRAAERMNNWTWMLCDWPSYRQTAEYIEGPRSMSAKAAKKRITQPIYLVAARVMVLGTGEVVGGFVPDSKTSQRQCRERKIACGTVVRAELRQPRNVGFHRLVHALGTLAREQIEALSTTVDAHDCIKRLQREAGVCCEFQEIDLGDLGKHQIKVARSIAFDSMDEGEFRGLMAGLCDHIAKRYWPDLDAARIEAMAELMVQR